MNRKTIRILMLLLVAMSLGIGEAKAETVNNVKYIDADGVEKTQDNVTVLEGSSSATVLPGGWYIVTGNNISYGSGLSFSGDTHLILADGAAMTVNGLSSSDDLSFYDQGGANPGKLISSVENSLGCKGISAKCLYINGGQITSNATKTGGWFVDDNCYAYGIDVSEKAIINGGQVVATGSKGDPAFGINCGGDITLGWTKSKDFIMCSSYHVGSSGSVKTANGKSFAVYSISGTTETLDGVVGEASGHIFLNEDSYGADKAQEALAGKRLRPFEGSVVGAVVGQQYLAYNNKNSGFKLLNGDAKLYVVTSVAYNESKFEVGLTEVDAGMVKAGVPVIFANATEGNPLPVSIYLGNATVTTDPKRLPNFIACDGSTSVANLLPSGLAYGDALFFGLSGNSFKRVLLASDDKPAAGKCFLAVPKQAYMDGTLKLGTEGSSSRSLGIETGGTTSLIDNGQLTMDNSTAAQWYSLDGRRLDKAPKAKGVYIRNGKKLVIR